MKAGQIDLAGGRTIHDVMHESDPVRDWALMTLLKQIDGKLDLLTVKIEKGTSASG